MARISLTTQVRLPAPLPSDRLHGLLDHLDGPRARLAVGLVAIHGLRPSEIPRLVLEDLDLARGTLHVRRRGWQHTVYLDALAIDLINAWLAERFRRWPRSPNPHLLVSSQSAQHPGLPPVDGRTVRADFRPAGLLPKQLWADRLLDEAKHTTDPVHLVRVFRHPPRNRRQVRESRASRQGPSQDPLIQGLIERAVYTPDGCQLVNPPQEIGSNGQLHDNPLDTTGQRRPLGGSVTAAEPSRARTIAWIGLTILGLFFLFAPVMDVLGTHAHGLPADHTGTFSKLAGLPIAAERAQSPGTAHYIATLEYGYALHELTFGLLFLAIVLFAFRRGERWAWFVCWAVMVASLGYTLTFGAHDSTTMSRSLVADIALPVLLLISAPSFFRHRRPAAPAMV
jgi:hypothetical protein